MEAIIAAQEAERANATRLILEAINREYMSELQANNLTDEQIGDIGILETPEQVRDYIFIALVETPEQREARRVQERAALQQLRENLRNEVQERANTRADTLINTGLPGQPMGGSRRRRKQSRKSRKHRR
jgi:hypothetical protein